MKLSNEQGFTLIELMVSLALISVIGIAVYGIFSYANSYLMTGKVLTSLHRDAYAAMDNMSMVLKEGKTIQVPSLIYSDVAVCGSTYTDLCSIDSTDQDGDTVSFFVDDSGALIRNNNDGSGDIVLIDAAEYQAGIRFTDNDPAVTIRVRVTLNNATIAETGRGNIVLVEGDDTGAETSWVLTECGEDCVELYTDVVNRNRTFTSS